MRDRGHSRPPGPGCSDAGSPVAHEMRSYKGALGERWASVAAEGAPTGNAVRDRASRDHAARISGAWRTTRLRPLRLAS